MVFKSAFRTERFCLRCAISLLVVYCQLALLPVRSSAQGDPLTELSTALEKVIGKVGPAVVQIETVGWEPDDDNEEYNEYSEGLGTRIEYQHGLGSGVIVDSSGYIITNAHLVEGAARITISLNGPLRMQLSLDAGKAFATTLPGRLVGTFKEADVAVIKVQAHNLPFLALGYHNTLRPGQLVLALGSPQGLQDSVSFGIVSSGSRQISQDGHIAYVQMDAALNPGNSGGPLVDTHGNLVGINAFLMSNGGGSEGLGFAIPSDLVEWVYRQILENGRVVRGDTGIRVQGVTRSITAGLHLPREAGVIVADTLPGTPAEVAGIWPQDVVLELDGTPVENVPQYYQAIYRKQPGKTVTLLLLRNSKKLKLRLPVIEAKEETNASATPIPRLGIACSSLAVDSHSAVRVRSRSGVVVVSPIAHATGHSNLEVGDVIRSVNLSQVSTVGELRLALRQIQSDDPIVLRVERKTHFLYVSANSGDNGADLESETTNDSLRSQSTQRTFEVGPQILPVIKQLQR